MILEWFKKWFANVSPLQPVIYDIVSCTKCNWCVLAENKVYYCNRPNGKRSQEVDPINGTVTITADTNGFSCHYERNNEYDSARETVLCGISADHFKVKE